MYFPIFSNDQFHFSCYNFTESIFTRRKPYNENNQKAAATLFHDSS